MTEVIARSKFVFDPDFEHFRDGVFKTFIRIEDPTGNFIRQQMEKTFFRRIFTWVKFNVFQVIRLVLCGVRALRVWGDDNLNLEIDVWRNAFLKAHLLRNEVVCCGSCNTQIPVNCLFKNTYHCPCCPREIHKTESIRIVRFSGWVPFLEKENIAIWRKDVLNERWQSDYMYKVKGYIHNLSACDLLQTLFDRNYRMEWDKTTLDVISVEDKKRNCEIVYWKLRWPAPHLNRDYVYKRQCGTLHRNRICVIQNKSIEHPLFPEKPGVVRVKQFRSILTIDPCVDFKNPGINYSLLYHEDPGEPHPMEMLSWFVSTGLSEFLEVLVDAGLEVSQKKI